MNDSRGEKSKVAATLSRELNLLHITMMGVGMMIGAGVFIGIGNAARIAGPGGMILTFALNGLIALFVAMSYAELSSAIPRAGGAYNFARIAFGRAPSFLAGWMEWFASSAAVASIFVYVNYRGGLPNGYHRSPVDAGTDTDLSFHCPGRNRNCTV